MDLEEFLKQIAELNVRVKDFQNLDRMICAEIGIWRRRYLDSLPKDSIEEKDIFVRTVFGAAPVAEIVKKSPEKLIEEIRKGYDEHHQD
jgi:hypothetical protein